jgi:alpha-1,2-mannosyltransferase
VNEKSIKPALACLFVLLYVPFLYQYGYRWAFANPGDFPTIYRATKLVFDEGGSPYTHDALKSFEAEVNRRVFPYLYPPPSLLAFYPFSLFSYNVAKVLLLVVSHVCFLAVLYLIFVRIRPFGGEATWLEAALMSVYVLTFNPVIDNFAWGQINLIVLALICLAWLAFKRGRHALLIALPLSLAVLLKTYPILLLPLLVIRKRFAAAAAVVALLGLYSLAAWLVLPRGLWADWSLNVAPTGGYGQRPFDLFLPVEPWNHSINGFFTFIYDRRPEFLGTQMRYITGPLSYLLSASVAAATAGLSFLSALKKTGERTLDVEVALFLLMIFLIAPLSWEHHLVYALPAALLAVHFLLRGGTGRGAAIGVVASLLVIAWDIPRDEMYLINGPLTILNAVKFFAAFALWCFVAWKLWGEVRGGVRGLAAPAPGV